MAGRHDGQTQKMTSYFCKCGKLSQAGDLVCREGIRYSGHELMHSDPTDKHLGSYHLGFFLFLLNGSEETLLFFFFGWL